MGIKKILILDNCLECSYCRWIMGKPRCKHPAIRMEEPVENWDDDGLLFPRCYTDGTQDIRKDCPLDDYEEEKEL